MDVRTLAALIHQPRNFLGNRFVYAVVSQRAGGFSVGINLNPDQTCNFDCLYCEVKRSPSNHDRQIDLPAMSKELKNVLGILQLGKIHELPGFANVPNDLLALKNVTLSGDGEPTHCPKFTDVVREVFHIREMPQFPVFKLVLITNGTGLHRKSVQEGIQLFSKTDEVWVKLDAGTQEYMWSVNKTRVPLNTVLDNITALGRQRPVVIQSLFCDFQGDEGPSDGEVEAYVQRLVELKNQGAQISLVQIYSVARPPAQPGCAHLRLSRLSHIARRVREAAGFRAEVY